MKKFLFPGTASGPRLLRQPVEHAALTDDALRRAWRQVRDARGGAGIDGMTRSAFEADLDAQLARLRRELLDLSYRSYPVLPGWLRKANGGRRPITIWAIRDRVAQRAIYNYLEPCFEPLFLPCSHGYRPGRSTRTAVTQVLRARDEGLLWVMGADIQECFEHIDPPRLMHFTRSVVRDSHILRLLEGWLQTPIQDGTHTRRAVGVTQGAVLSPLQCNIYLHPFDMAVTRQGYRMVRYADDLVVLCRHQREANAAREVVRKELAEVRMEVKPAKTRITHFDQGVDFLGFHFKGKEYHAG